MPEDKTPNWTPQQLQAIKARDADVLVSASAGTGKTAVLSGRCVDLVADKKICPDIWSILVLTFTDAAAQQMRSRIAEHLRNTIAKKPDKHLKHQLLLLQGADISTIHAFCKRLITDHFYELGIDPAFRVIDSDEAKLLKAQILEKTIEWAWLQSNLTEPITQLFSRRDIRSGEGFLKKIINISDFLDTIVSRQNWYKRADLLAQHADSFAGSLGQKQKQIVEEKLKRAIDQLNQAENLYKTTHPNGDWQETCRQNYIQPIAQCLEALQADDWDKTARLIIEYKKPRIKTPKDIPEQIAELIKDTTKKALDSVTGLSNLAVINPDYMDKVAIHTSRQTRVLVELIRKFDQLYDQAKRNANCMDFADLEHHALKLLTEENSTDKPSPSRTALALRNIYKYIFVDEYQDINSVQKTILDMLSPGGNIFVVGDVKQSIYAWRGAKPDIFIEQLSLAANKQQNATRVDLNANFRSAEGILNFVNKIFERIMTASFAKIDYDESAMLKAAATKTQSPQQCNVEFHLIDKKPQDQNEHTTETEDSSEENPNTIDSTQQQAALIAKRINKMVGAESGKPEFQIFDKQQDISRDVQYRDIVILMRSLAKKAIHYVEILRLAGVPVSCDSVAGYFEATEISDMLSLLKVLDNPQRDIELTAVLRSPLFSFSDTELTKIRTAENTNNDKSFHRCVQNFNADDTLAQKLKKAIETIENWRTLARRGSIADLIWQIYRSTNYLSFVSALPNGQARRANLLKLHDRAIQFEGFVSTGPVASLTRFVEFIEKLQELGQDWAPAQPDSSAANAVRILSVHKSKGLEFPVVFIAELNGKFNISDTNQECLTDSDHALGLKIIDPNSNTRLSSLAHQVIAEQKRNITLAEEMRILYVATTRAKERLILTASEKLKKCRGIITQGLLLGPKKISDWQLRSCTSSLQWLLYGLCDQKQLHTKLETDLENNTADDGLFDFTLYGQKQQDQFNDWIKKLKTDKLKQIITDSEKTKPTKESEKLLTKIKESIQYKYHFGTDPLLPAKMSVTQITHRDDEFANLDYSGILDRLPAALLTSEDNISEPPAARLIGTATHLVISELDLTKPINIETVNTTKEKLLLHGHISEAIANLIDTESIVEFFNSTLGQTALDPKNTVSREWPFTFAHQPQDSSSKIVVQGIIDMLIKTPNGLIIIDFKTDNITETQTTERAKLYAQQLKLYAQAASKILNKKTNSLYLYFLNPRKEHEIS